MIHHIQASDQLTLGLTTNGGDCPGLNAVIHEITRLATAKGWRVLGIRNGILGALKEYPEIIELTPDRLSPELPYLPSTMLGTSRDKPENGRDISEDMRRVFKQFGINFMVATVGEGSFPKLGDLMRKIGTPLGVIPKTIDNNIGATEFTVGFHSAVAQQATEIDCVRESAKSVGRVAVIETMGRKEGQLALHAGLRARADVILLPEITPQFSTVVKPHILNVYAERVRMYEKALRNGGLDAVNPSVTVVVAEGANREDGEPVAKTSGQGKGDHAVYGGIGEYYRDRIEQECRIGVSYQGRSYNSRGIRPWPGEVALARRFAAAAIEGLDRGEKDFIVTLHGDIMELKPIKGNDHILGHVRMNNPHLLAGRQARICFGD